MEVHLTPDQEAFIRQAISIREFSFVELSEANRLEACLTPALPAPTLKAYGSTSHPRPGGVYSPGYRDWPVAPQGRSSARGHVALGGTRAAAVGNTCSGRSGRSLVGARRRPANYFA